MAQQDVPFPFGPGEPHTACDCIKAFDPDAGAGRPVAPDRIESGPATGTSTEFTHRICSCPDNLDRHPPMVHPHELIVSVASAARDLDGGGPAGTHHPRAAAAVYFGPGNGHNRGIELPHARGATLQCAEVEAAIEVVRQAYGLALSGSFMPSFSGAYDRNNPLANFDVDDDLVKRMINASICSMTVAEAHNLYGRPVLPGEDLDGPVTTCLDDRALEASRRALYREAKRRALRGKRLPAEFMYAARPRDKFLRRVIIKTDSDYLAAAMTENMRKWSSNGWKTSKGKEVRNAVDLQYLSGIVHILMAQCGVQVLFWKVPRSKNQEAIALARRTAESYH